MLFLSPRAIFASGTGIRGGVPVCFPWFANHASDPTKPAHGFARTTVWALDEPTSDERGHVRLVLRLTADAATRARWPHEFAASLAFSLGERLEMALAVQNAGSEPLTYEAALHTYLRVGDVERVTIQGLERTRYLDKVDGMREQTSSDEPITPAGEIDRVFVDTMAACRVVDPVLGRTLRVDKTGSRTTVVWNPGPDKGPAVPDLGGETWRTFVCVETANTGTNAVRLAPGTRHEMTAAVSLIDGPA